MENYISEDTVLKLLQFLVSIPSEEMYTIINLCGKVTSKQKEEKILTY